MPHEGDYFPVGKGYLCICRSIFILGKNWRRKKIRGVIACGLYMTRKMLKFKGFPSIFNFAVYFLKKKKSKVKRMSLDYSSPARTNEETWLLSGIHENGFNIFHLYKYADFTLVLLVNLSSTYNIHERRYYLYIKYTNILSAVKFVWPYYSVPFLL